METTINERFISLIKAVNMNTNSFAKSIDKAYTSVEAICKSKTKPSYDLLESVFRKYPQLSRDWLLMGDGEMFRNMKQPDQGGPTDEYLHDHLRTLEENFTRLAHQLEMKDQQIAGLQRTVDALVGKSEGVTIPQLSDEEIAFETMFRQYRQLALGNQPYVILPKHQFSAARR